uniref:Acyltransferase 3 domain-containing protein n=1 Tax=Glossina brevipalpis TaxID=37001 RepID=A0A1A9WWJ3_9MUSC
MNYFIRCLYVQFQCSHHTWYLATDMQLFVFFVIVAIVISRFPKLKKYIFIIIALASIVITSAVTYGLKLDTFVFLTPENYRFLVFKDSRTFYQSYLPFYMNLGGYLGGFVLADIYNNYIKSNDKLKKRFMGALKYELCYFLIYIALLVLLCISSYFVGYDIERPQLLAIAFAGLFRNIWVVLTILAVLGNFLKLGSIVLRIFSLPILNVFNKISYQMYLWHMTVFRIFIGFYRQPVYANLVYTINLVAGVIFITCVVAFIVTLVVEYPLANLISYSLKREKGKFTNNSVNNQS